jgi:hypothetical protein
MSLQRYWKVMLMKAIIAFNVVTYTIGNRSVYSLNIHLVLEACAIISDLAQEDVACFVLMPDV